RMSPRKRAASGATQSAVDDLDEKFARAFERLAPPKTFVIGVSGGGDSLALMRLAADWALGADGRLTVLTVDHGLHNGSAGQAKRVVREAKRAGLPACILTWRGKKPATGIEEAARAARYRLMGEWCRENGADAILLAHTRDDQAETFLLRLARGSGV